MPPASQPFSDELAFADAMPAVTCVCDGRGSLRFANRAWYAFTGLAPEDSLGTAWTRAVHADDVRGLAAAFAAHETVREPFDREFRLRRADGTFRWMRGRAAPLEAGSAALWISTFTDVDDLKRATPDRSGDARLSDAHLRRLFDSDIVGIVIANNAGSIIEANEYFLKLLGYTREDLDAGRVDWRNATPPEWLALDERAIGEMEARGEFAQYEKEYVRRDGTRVPVSLGGARIAGTNDEQICYILDITERRRAEAALRRSESRFSNLAAANVFGIMNSRYSDNTIVEANDELLRTIGYSRADLEAGLIRWTNITPPEYQEAGRLAMLELRDTGRFKPLEKEYVRKDGSRVPVLVGGALLEGSGEDITCYVLDLSAQREAGLRLAESERRYRLLADAVPELIMLAGADRRFTYVNKQYETYTGLTLADLPEKWRDTIHPDDLAAVDRVRATGGPYEIEYRLRRADGRYRWHFGRVIEIPGGMPDARWLGAMMDIDDRKRAEESLRFIEKAGSLLARSLDLETTFETLVDLVVPSFGDWAAITLRDESGEPKTRVVRHADPAVDDLARQLLGVNYYKPGLDWGTAGAYLTGTPQLSSSVDRSALENAVKPEYVHVFEAMGYGSVVALPIFSGDEVVGAFGVVSKGDRRRYTEADLPPLEELARRAGFAIENARQYEREHRVASLLQEAALPRELPRIDGFTFDGYYRAGRQEAQIGGDWFDVLEVSDGRIVVSVGDVAGSGLHAAVLMGNVRQVIRAAANVFADPMMMLDVADRTLRSEHEDRMVTAFVGVIDPQRKTIQYASAGHLPALLRAADGTIAELSTPGLPLGYRGLGGSASRSTVLPPGSCLLLYTDGLVEWSRDIVVGEALLRDRFAEALGTPRACSARALVESILSPGGARDDVAALTVAVAGG
jgi:PAS domain S-box-containing protein